MNKKQGILIAIALMLLFIGIALATQNNLSTSSDIEIYAFDQNPTGRDKGSEWVTLYNPSNESVDIGNWILETADGERETIAEGTTLYPGDYYVYTPLYQWLDNREGSRPKSFLTINLIKNEECKFKGEEKKCLQREKNLIKEKKNILEKKNPPTRK